jgi:hypothetical protein
VSTTQAELVAKFAVGVVDTSGKFAAGVVETGGNCRLCRWHRLSRHSDRPWASSLHMVQKVDGIWRLCGDFRRLSLVMTLSVNKAVASRNGNRDFTGKQYIRFENNPRSPQSQTGTH